MNAESITDFIQEHDLSTKEGKSKLWRLLAPLGSTTRKSIYIANRDKYLADGLSVGPANTMAVLDLAASLDSASELPEGLINSLRPIQIDEEVVSESSNVSKKQIIDELVLFVKENTKNISSNIAKSVSWTSENLCLGKDQLDAESVPSLEALTMFLWAKHNETEFRRLYDSKRIPSRGLASDKESGFVDDGTPIQEIILRIKSGLEEKDE